MAYHIASKLQCDSCSETFNRQSSLIRHKKNRHSACPPVHKCNSCSKNFTRRDLLLRHERLHRGEGFQPCELCCRSFRRDYLDKHLKRCRIRAFKPLSCRSIIDAPDGQERDAFAFSELQWQDPHCAPTQRTFGRNDQSTTRVQQPFRYVCLIDPQEVATESELLEQALSAVETWDGGLSVFKAVVQVWQARGLALKRLDELSIASNGSTLIARACYDFTSDIAEYNLSLDLDFVRKDELGRTALHWLCRNGLTSLVECLLKKTDVNSSLDRNGDSPLCLACRNGHWDVVNLLCKYGASVNVKGRAFSDSPDSQLACCTPLEYAVARRARSSVEALLEAQADPNLRGKLMPLETAILQGGADEVSLLLAAGAEIDLIEAYYVRLLQTQEISVPDVVQKQSLLETYSRTNCSERWLHPPSTSYLARGEALRAMLTEDLSFFTKSLDGIHNRSMLVGDLRNFSEHQRGHSHNWNPLMRAAHAGAFKCLSHMLCSSPDLSLADNAGWTALHHACRSGNHEAIRTLLEKGAEIDHCSKKNSTPLCIAAMKGHIPTISLLIDMGANIDGKVPSCSSSPLYWACTKNHGNAVALLVAKGADVNRGKKNVKPLEQALQYGSASIVSILLSAGASTSSVHETSWIDLRVAVEQGHSERWLEAAEKVRLIEAALDEENPESPARELGYIPSRLDELVEGVFGWIS